MPGPTSYRDKFRYRFDNFMARGGSSIFLSLFVVFVLALVAVGILRLVAYSAAPGTDERESGFLNHIYITFLQMTDPGNMAQDIESNPLYKIAAITAGIVGVILLSMLIGLITTALDQKLHSLRKGHSQVIEEEHTLILGWSPQRVVEILRELILANESEDNPAVVILADQPKDEMDDYLALVLPDTQNTRVVTRSGLPSSLTNLKIAAVETCRSAIVLATAKESSDAETKAKSDAKVIKTILAISSVRSEAGGEDSDDGGFTIVAELFSDQHRSIVQENCRYPISVADSSDILAKIMVQTSRSVGLSVVYTELLSFDGCEMYFHGDEGWAGIAFGDLAFHFPDGVPLGIRTTEGELHLNPPLDRPLAADDEILIVADDDSTIEFRRQPVATARDLPLNDERLEKRVEHELFIGWNRKGSIMIEEYADYVVDGSSIDIICDHPTDDERNEIRELDERLPGLEIRLIEKDPLEIENLAALEPATRNNIILLSDADDSAEAEEIDARSLMILLLLRRLFSQHGDGSHSPQLITEVMDSANQGLVSSAGVKDFIISDRFISMILAQMSEEADIKRVYDDLFEEDGSEIYLKPTTHYFESLPIDVSFADCMGIAQKRGEVCLGVKLKDFETEAGLNYGVKLIPEKNRRYTLGPHDCLVVLAEDET